MTIFRHKKSGGLYEVVAYARMQSMDWTMPGKNPNASGGHLAPVDHEEVVVYRSHQDGATWVRPREEFEDGRFEQVSN